MKRPEVLVLGKEGPRVALKRMRERGLSGLMVVDRTRKLVGILTAEAARSLLDEKSDRSMEDVLVRDVVMAHKDTPVSELLPKMAEKQFSHPAAVIDDQGKLRGVVVQGAIFAALAGNGVKQDEPS
jgi:glycine betaine/proline transport system ATP-binding protein